MARRSPKPVFSRPPDEEAELDAWVESFARAMLGIGESVVSGRTPQAGDGWVEERDPVEPASK